MARRTNYSFEKRQKEIKRAKKREQKLARKQAKKEGDEGGPPIAEMEDGAPRDGDSTEAGEAPAGAEGSSDEVVGPA